MLRMLRMLRVLDHGMMMAVSPALKPLLAAMQAGRGGTLGDALYAAVHRRKWWEARDVPGTSGVVRPDHDVLRALR